MDSPVTEEGAGCPARLSRFPLASRSSAAALRYQAEVSARKLVEAVYVAGGEPLTIHPSAPAGAVSERRSGPAAGLRRRRARFPGAAICTQCTMAGPSMSRCTTWTWSRTPSTSRWRGGACASGRPLLAICRGMQVVNVAMGGTLVQDMPRHHRHVRSELALRPGTAVYGVLGRDTVTISCYHHQAVDRIGAGLRPTRSSEDGVVEAIELTEPGRGWFLAVQWHPEDTAADDPAQQHLFDALVSAADSG